MHETINKNEKVDKTTRLKYVGISNLLFILGLLIMLTFFLIFTIVFALAIWAWSGIFMYVPGH
ncbi:MAG: hypothetical protein H5T33_07310 [Candidatus Methanosuratus sp.]|nr:hypothetical protein [Candidatus Methanosuratincola sp.]